MNARFNASIDANDYYKWAIHKIDSTQLENFTKTLPILIKIDSNQTAVSNAELNEVIRLTSLVAERHSNSRYLDESYLLLGKARLFKGDFTNATEIFKYLNSNNNSEEVRQQGLIWLMRSYLESNDFKKADEVSKELSKLTLYKKNRPEFYEVKAAYHQKVNELALAAAFLDESLKYMKKSTHKARAHYIAGQLYSSLQQGSLARNNWKMVVKNKPTYDLEFNAGIELLMIGSNLGENANGTFLKMLEDRKNVDLKDKIYFKMAESKAIKGNYQSAIKDYSLSASLATNANQKASAYLKIAEIYHSKIQNYELASSYYDSTLLNINERSPDFEIIKSKANSLSDFVKYQRVIKLEDSLQVLAALNPLALESKIEQMLKIELNEKKRISDEAAKLVVAEKNKVVSGNFGSSNPNKWFFYDQLSLTRSRSDFIREWGNRNLEDNWRRKDKEIGSISFQIERGIVTEEEKEESKIDLLAEQENAKKMAELETKKAAILAQIPSTYVKLIQSKRKQEEGYYQLGKIYKLQFNEIDNARKTFTTLLEKYPNTPYEQEALYFMALMADNQQNNSYRDALISKFPFSSYARQLLRGVTNVDAATESNAEREYEVLYNTFVNGDYVSALKKAEKGLYDYTGTSLEDKFAMLRILILAKNGNENIYRIALMDFMKSYPSSSLSTRVTNMLASITKKP